jgi:Leucine-rich repeat (LRR) protein
MHWFIVFQELYLGHNSLSSLPPEIGQLLLLQTLDVSNNCLNKVPEEIGDLPALCLLDLRANPKLSLPLSLQQNSESLQILTDLTFESLKGKLENAW